MKSESEQSEDICYFYGGGVNALSNFAAYKVNYDEQIWMTAEHAYQAQKFVNSDVKEEIAQAPSAYAAKQTAGKYEGEVRDDWFGINVDIMKQILQAKIDQHKHVREVLKRTKGKKLVENSEDEFWGRGSNGEGDNKFGELWMNLREKL